MSIISTGDFAKDLEPLTGVWVDQGYARYGEEYAKVFKVINKQSAYFEDQRRSGLGLPQPKPQGEAILYDKMSQRWAKRYSATAYGLGIQITHEMISDGTALDIAQSGMKELGAGLSDLKNTVAFNVLNNAFSGSYASGGDGKELCATDHPVDSGTTSNELATPAALSVSSLKQCFIEMKAMKDLTGNKMKVLPKSLIVPRDLMFDCEVIFKSDGLPGSTDHDVNYIKSSGIFPGGYQYNDWLTSTTAYYIMTDADERGLIFFDRERMLSMRDRDTDTMNAKFLIYSRFGVGWTDYNNIFGSAGA